MLKIMLMLLLFAAYGAYSFLNELAGEPTQVISTPTTDPAQTITDSVVGRFATTAGTYVAKAATSSGLEIIPLQGEEPYCETGTVDAQKLGQVVEALPQGQQAFFGQLLSKAPANTLPQIYKKEGASGLCFTSLSVVVLLPL